MEIDITLFNLTIMPKYRIYAISLGTLETENGSSPSLFLASFIDGRYFLDILYLRVPILKLLGRATGGRV